VIAVSACHVESAAVDVGIVDTEKVCCGAPSYVFVGDTSWSAANKFSVCGTNLSCVVGLAMLARFKLVE